MCFDVTQERDAWLAARATPPGPGRGGSAQRRVFPPRAGALSADERASGQPPTERLVLTTILPMARAELSPTAALVIAWVMSASVFIIGCLPLSLAARGDYPWGFASGLTVCFWTLAVWNVRTLPRDSEIPTGRWLAVLSALCMITGLVGVWSSNVGQGAMLLLLGCAGAFASWWESRATRAHPQRPAVPSSTRHERDASDGPERPEAYRGSGHRGRPRRLELWVSGAWLLGLAGMFGFMLLSIAGDYETGPAHPRLALALVVVWLASFAAAWILQDRWEKTAPPTMT